MKSAQHTEAAAVRQAESVQRLPSGGALKVEGPHDAPPILFLHGVAGGGWSWEPQATALRADFRCASWDARGHGEAPVVGDAGLSDYFTDANEALDVLGREQRRPAFIAGHSMGGLLAMALAAERPSEVAGVFLVEPVYNPSGVPHFGGAFSRAGRWLISPFVGSVQRNGPVARFIAKAMFERSFEDRRLMESWWPIQQRQVPLEYPKMFYEAFEGTTGFPNRAFAREIDAPVTLVEGSMAKDGPRFPELNRELASRLGPRFTYRVVGGGHYLQLDRAPAVTSLLRTFVESA